MTSGQRFTKRIFIVTCAILLSTGITVAQGAYTDFDIYSVNVRTGELTQLTSIPNAGEFNASWSNNGKLIAHDVVDGPAALGHAIYITEVRTGISTPLAGAEGGNDAVWASAGNKIAFDRIPVGDASIYVTVRGESTRTLIRSDAVGPDWSPGSSYLVFSQPSDGSIRTVHEGGGTATLIGYGLYPVWSPNGKWIAFVSDGHIWKVRVNSSGVPLSDPIQVTTDPGYYYHTSWSNNSRTIVVQTGLSGDHDLLTIPASGGALSELFTDVGFGEYDPSYSRNGRYVAFSGYTDPSLAKPITSPEITAPGGFTLCQNYPNPFNPSTSISYTLSESGNISLRVYDFMGRLVATPVAGHQDVGFHSVQFTAENMSSGTYLYVLQTDGSQEVKKMILLK